MRDNAAFCFVRQRAGDRMVLTTYGRSSGFCVDPIEKKPLNHFLPGTSVLSFGTAGCNLGYRFCQNWDISKARAWDKLADAAPPEQIALAAQQLGNRFRIGTFLWLPIGRVHLQRSGYFRRVRDRCGPDLSRAWNQGGRRHAGYITDDARPEFYRHMDAANVDLKAFTDAFYHRLCFAQLGPVLDTLKYLRYETNVWFEVTTLLIPSENDSDAELHRATEWFAQNLRTDVAWHFTAFHPDFKMLDKPHTPPAMLARAREIAHSKGTALTFTPETSMTAKAAALGVRVAANC